MPAHSCGTAWRARTRSLSSARMAGARPTLSPSLSIFYLTLPPPLSTAAINVTSLLFVSGTIENEFSAILFLLLAKSNSNSYRSFQCFRQTLVRNFIRIPQQVTHFFRLLDITILVASLFSRYAPNTIHRMLTCAKCNHLSTEITKYSIIISCMHFFGVIVNILVKYFFGCMYWPEQYFFDGDQSRIRLTMIQWKQISFEIFVAY